MKRIFLIAALFALACDGGTKVNIGDVKIAFDPACLTLDTSTSTPTLRLNPACQGGNPGIDVSDELTAALGQTVLTTSAVPVSMVDVYRNGLIQSSKRTPADYTTALDPATQRIIVTIPLALAGDSVTFRYRR